MKFKTGRLLAGTTLMVFFLSATNWAAGALEPARLAAPIEPLAAADAWNATTVLSWESTGVSRDAALVLDQDGTIHVAWSDNADVAGAGTDYDVFYRNWTASSGWGPLVLVSSRRGAPTSLP
ncbi:MAG: hypothetical protein Kow0069_38450 [Promethearchaeota archaeon]